MNFQNPYTIQNQHSWETFDQRGPKYDMPQSTCMESRALGHVFATPPTGGAKRRTRTVFDSRAVCFLDAEFKQNPYPDYERRMHYGRMLAVTEDRIQVWFQNKRSRTKTKKPTASVKRGPPSNTVSQTEACLQWLHNSETGSLNSPTLSLSDSSSASEPPGKFPNADNAYHISPSVTSSTPVVNQSANHPAVIDTLSSSSYMQQSSADDVFNDPIPISQQQSSENTAEVPPPLKKKRPASLRLDSLELPLSTPCPSFFNGFSPLWNVPFSPLYVPKSPFMATK